LLHGTKKKKKFTARPVGVHTTLWTGNSGTAAAGVHWFAGVYATAVTAEQLTGPQLKVAHPVGRETGISNNIYLRRLI